MPSSANPKLPRGVVLCIDDNQNVLECDKAFLETFGYTVLIAPSGSKGLELASIHSVDIVIVDYFMPEMNGPEVALEMRRLRPQAPIIMLSAATKVDQFLRRLITHDDRKAPCENLAVCKPVPGVLRIASLVCTDSPQRDAGYEIWRPKDRHANQSQLACVASQ